MNEGATKETLWQTIKIIMDNIRQLVNLDDEDNTQKLTEFNTRVNKLWEQLQATTNEESTEIVLVNGL